MRAKAAVAISLAPTQEFVMGSAQTEVRSHQHAAALGVWRRWSLLTQRRCLPQIDHLAGRSGGYSPTAPVKSSGSATNPHEGRVEVIVRGSGTVKVAVDWQRGGQTAAEVTVDADAPASSL
eukprot:COSAG04_NODE_1294_length_7333_cov_3.307575_2_plen_121_part_00